ncbi:NAD-dependent epimerase/dehydratase family protein [Auraticoccus sp. F435]|uniref:NAD-dependent epimerase/dehydratase family protein n=1 Tax=Auraticoccus cholistanensis TaxID=2656650 RepID=A0A6A9UWJ5_9ACTN|nr:NAD(P)-dependent oxidoreductase [Auraticoccus cholistanensis]MVA77078.1 NAD-dependent epimerase/dehydratase family protein [Auraticoccus cholistanensis]
MNQLVLITGGAGYLGSRAAHALAGAGHRVRLLDVREVADPPEGAELFRGSVTDAELLARATEGVDAVLHFGGLPRERPWQEILEINIDGTQKVLEAARQAGVGKVHLASSNHAVGWYRAADAPPGGLPADCLPLPDTYYGVSKATMEALGALYHHRFGIDVLVVRIGTLLAEPTGARTLVTWFSPGDHDAMLLAWLQERTSQYRIVWGISPNTRGWFDVHHPTIEGYTPKGDAERELPHLVAEHPLGSTPADDPTVSHLGGSFRTAPLGVPMA